MKKRKLSKDSAGEIETSIRSSKAKIGPKQKTKKRDKVALGEGEAPEPTNSTPRTTTKSEARKAKKRTAAVSPEADVSTKIIKKSKLGSKQQTKAKAIAGQLKRSTKKSAATMSETAGEPTTVSPQSAKEEKQSECIANTDKKMRSKGKKRKAEALCPEAKSTQGSAQQPKKKERRKLKESEAGASSEKKKKKKRKAATAADVQEEGSVKKPKTKRLKLGDVSRDSRDNAEETASKEAEVRKDEGDKEKAQQPQPESDAIKEAEQEGKAVAEVELAVAAVAAAGANPAGGSAAKAFQRVNADDWLGKRGSSNNSYRANFGSSGWGAKAEEVLGKVRGKDFRHEKTKKKRGSYRGGVIDGTINSIKFDSDDE